MKKVSLVTKLSVLCAASIFMLAADQGLAFDNMHKRSRTGINRHKTKINAEVPQLDGRKGDRWNKLIAPNPDLSKYHFRGWRNLHADDILVFNDVILSIKHENSKHYGGINITDKSSGRTYKNKTGNPQRYRWVGLEYLLFDTQENQSKYGGFVPLKTGNLEEGNTWKVFERTRNDKLGFAHTLEGKLLLGVDETANSHGGLYHYTKNGRKDRIVMGDPYRIAKMKNALFVFTTENDSRYEGMYIVNSRNMKYVGRVYTPASVEPFFNKNLLFVGGKEASRKHGGVYVFDLINNKKRYFHRSGDPVRFGVQGGVIKYNCRENSSNHGGILLLDVNKGSKISYEK